MLPILFKVGPVTIYSFGFFLALAYFAATFILWREGKRQGYNPERLLDLSVISLIAAIVGGRLYFALLNWRLFVDEPLTTLVFWEGGFAYHGSLLVVLIIGYLFIKKWKWSFFQIADIGALAASAALVLGKIGSFLAGLDFGEETSVPWAVNLPGIVGERHPVQLYEAAGFLAIFILLYVLYFRNLAAPNMRSGKVFFIFLILSGVLRAALEFYRADPKMIASFPIASLVGLSIAVVAVVAIYYFQIRDFREDARGFLKGFFGFNSRLLRRLKI